MDNPSYEDLQLANRLITLQQHRSYWESEPVPIRPQGRVFLEPFRQLITFLGPIILVAWSAHQISIYTIAATTPIAIFIGYLLDRQLKWSINRKRDREHDRDRGRYHAVRTLSYTLSLPPSHITLKMIEKMAIDFEIESTWRASKEQRRLEAMCTSAKKQKVPPEVQRGTGPAGGSALPYTVIESTFLDSIIDEPSTRHWEPESWIVNPATGLPMNGIYGLGVDVGGNSFGSEY